MCVSRVLLAGAAAAVATSAHAVPLDIPAGSLGSVVATIGTTLGVTIGVADPAVAAQRSLGVRGNVGLRAALALALRGTTARAIFTGASVVIVARPARRVTGKQTAPAPPAETGDIVVTASKQATALDRYPGSVTVLDLDVARAGIDAARGSEASIARLPVLTSTGLGPGRDKIFIRGIADSSFNGPSQATIAQYLGEARMTYNAPDPDLNLTDMARVEVLVGPQGTLYGTGSLGGVIRLVPNAPDPGAPAARGAAGVLATQHGGIGGDVAGMVNVPLGGAATARIVGFAREDPGYIDDPGRGLRDINRSRSFGGRAALRLDDLRGWRVDVGGAWQAVRTRDGQYALRDTPALTRRSQLAQPFVSDYGIGYLTGQRQIGAVALVSTTAVARHDTRSTFDASGDASAAARFDEQIVATVVSHETRASGGDDRPWVAGVAGVHAVARVVRRLGPVGGEVPIAGVCNVNSELAAFGRYTVPLTDSLDATIGARLTYAWSVGKLLDELSSEEDEPRRSDIRLVPSAALAWRAAPLLLLFAQVQQGFRAGGLAVVTTGTTVDGQRFRPDTLTTGEIGARFGRSGIDPFAFALTLSHARWRDIQADLIDSAGLPFTDNIGDGRVNGFEASAAWQASESVNLDLVVFVNDSTLSAPIAAMLAADERALPNIPEHGGRIAVGWRRNLAPVAVLTADGSLRYLGRSQLGVGMPLDVEQGGTLSVDTGARLAIGRLGFGFEITNALDVRGNRFAFGNPFGLSRRDQMTPLRPRSVRLSFDIAW